MSTFRIERLHSYEVIVPRYMMEITTNIGCVVDCLFCPQQKLAKAYTSTKRMLSFGDFKIAIDKLPNESIIIFSGFSEPFLNDQCTKMILYAHHKKHPISLFTTTTGMTQDDLNKIKNIPFSQYPHGGFVLHLADNEGFAKITVDDKYLSLLESIKKSNISNLMLRTMGSLHDDVKNIFQSDTVKKQQMNSRAGNLSNSDKTLLQNSKNLEGIVLCSRDEYIYNNVMLPNGDVVLCCQDFGLKHVLGNIIHEGFQELLPTPFSSYSICKMCHNGVMLPSNFPVVNFMHNFKF